MFNLSGSEMIFLLLIALVVLGPEKLPEAVRKFGKAYGEFKKMTTGFQSELRSALDEPMKEMRETADQLRKSANLDFNFNFEPDRVDGDTGLPAADSAPVAGETVVAAAADAVATDAVVADAVVSEPAASTPAPPAVDVSAFGLGSSAPVPAVVDISDVNATAPAAPTVPESPDVVEASAAAPDVVETPAPQAPAAPNGWSPLAPTAPAPTPSGWSPVTSGGAVGSSNDEVTPG